MGIVACLNLSVLLVFSVPFDGQQSQRQFKPLNLINQAFAQSAPSKNERDIEKKNVLFINSYHSGYLWSDNVDRGIQSVLGDKNIEIFTEYLDSKRYTGQDYFNQKKNIIRYKYSTTKIDAIIVSDHHAFNLMLEMRKTFHTDVPLVFCGIDRIDPDSIANYAPIYGLEERDGGIQSTLNLILSIHHDIYKIFFVADQTYSAKVMLKYVKEREPFYKKAVKFDYLINLSKAELKTALKSLPPKSVVMWLHFIKDRDGELFSVTESQSFIANNASVPVYTCWGFSADTGIVGGSIIYGFTQGQKAAQIVVKLFNKEDIKSVPIYQQAPLTNMFDYKVMKRFNIGLKDVPQGSVIYNKPFSVYEEYRWQIISIVILVIVQALLLGFLFINRAKRKQAEEDVHKSYDYLKHLTDSIPDAVFSVKMPERTIEWANDSYQVLGYEPEDCVGESTEKFYRDPGDYQAFGALLADAIQERKEILSAEALLRRKNREFFPAEIRSTVYRKDGEVVSVTSLVRDITERKKVEEAIKDSEEKFRNLMEQSPFSIQIIKPDGRVDQFNKAFMDLWGISEETLPEVLEKYNVFEDEEAKKLGVMPLIEKACRGETVILPEIEYDAHRTMENLEIVSTGSKKVWIKVRLYPIKNSNGEVVNVVFIEEDITDRKQAEREILRYHERLKALASQLTVTEEKERRRIAVDLHDHVGQSLALARMQIDSAKKSAADDRLAARLDEISENLRKAIHDTRHLIFDLSPPAMHQIGLGAAVSEWLEEQIEKRYGIKTEFFDNIEQRYRKTLDDNVRAILFRNVRELLINMVKHAQANQVSVSMEITDGALKTVIQDNGIGFDQSSEIQNVKSEEGFGLFSIKERMADLGGALKIESQPGKGCKAVLTVPLSIDDDKEIL